MAKIRDRLGKDPTGQIWDYLNIKINNDNTNNGLTATELHT